MAKLLLSLSSQLACLLALHIITIAGQAPPQDWSFFYHLVFDPSAPIIERPARALSILRRLDDLEPNVVDAAIGEKVQLIKDLIEAGQFRPDKCTKETFPFHSYFDEDKTGARFAPNAHHYLIYCRVYQLTICMNHFKDQLALAAKDIPADQVEDVNFVRVLLLEACERPQYDEFSFYPGPIKPIAMVRALSKFASTIERQPDATKLLISSGEFSQSKFRQRLIESTVRNRLGVACDNLMRSIDPIVDQMLAIVDPVDYDQLAHRMPMASLEWVANVETCRMFQANADSLIEGACKLHETRRQQDNREPVGVLANLRLLRSAFNRSQQNDNSVREASDIGSSAV